MAAKTLKWVIASVMAIIVIILAAWIVVAGPTTVGRIIRYGDTNIDDYSHYPGRQLVASQDPYRFERSETVFRLPDEALEAFGSEPDLRSLVAGNDSIAFLVIKDGRILREEYFQDHSAGRLSQLFSVSKSITSLLIGMAIDDGTLGDVKTPITEYVPELAAQGYDQVTLEHLLTMTSGTAYQENDNPFGEHVILNYTPDLEAELLAVGMQSDPGKTFRYKSGDNALLALALSRALSEESITDFAQRRLWGPMGAEQRAVWTIDSDEGAMEKSWCCLATTARDLAKIGQLLLQEGHLAGKQLVSAEWVKASTSSQVASEIWPEEFSEAGWRNYGYQWWLVSEEHGDYFALGKDGQFLYVNPAREVVIVRMGWSSGELLASQWIRLFQQVAAQTEGS